MIKDRKSISVFDGEHCMQSIKKHRIITKSDKLLIRISASLRIHSIYCLLALGNMTFSHDLILQWPNDNLKILNNLTDFYGRSINKIILAMYSPHNENFTPTLGESIWWVVREYSSSSSFLISSVILLRSNSWAIVWEGLYVKQIDNISGINGRVN